MASNRDGAKELHLNDGTIVHYFIKSPDIFKHNRNGPAVLYPDGTQEWWYMGKKLDDMTREVTDDDGVTHVFDDEMRLHNLEGPALWDEKGTENWYRHGKRHREDGPAITEKHSNGKTYYRWFLDDIKYDDLEQWAHVACKTDEEIVQIKLIYGLND